MTVKAKPRGVAQFEATVRELSEQVAKARLRTARMEGATTDRDKDLPHDPTALREALEEVRVHQQELAVAHEALRAQLDALGHSNLRARAERDRYQQLFDLAPDAYFVTDRLGVIRDVNASGARILAIEARFLIGKPLAALIDIADTRTLREGIEMLRTKPAIELEVRLRPRNAEPHCTSSRPCRSRPRRRCCGSHTTSTRGTLRASGRARRRQYGSPSSNA